MRHIICTVLFLLSQTVFGQIVNLKFDGFKNEEIKHILLSSNNRFIKTLHSNGFSDKDTVNLYFNYPKEYVWITHNLNTEKSVDLLYRNLVLHYSFLMSAVDHYKIDNLRLFVRLKQDEYLMWESYSDIKGEKVKMKDRLFAKDYFN